MNTIELEDRLKRAEADILKAVADGEPSLEAVSNDLAGILADVEQASSNNNSFAFSGAASDMSQRILFISEQVLEFQTIADQMTHELHTELQDAFAQIEVPSLTKPRPRSRPQVNLGPAPDVPTLDSFPPYLACAYLWLVENLHNPYPTKATRNQIAEKTGSTRELIDAWFVGVRQRIGWTALRKRQFSNKRADIVKAATQFFFPHKFTETLDSTLEMEFATMEKTATDLYGGRFTGVELIPAEPGQPSKVRPKKKTAKRSPVNPYPSPAPSSDETDAASFRDSSTQSRRGWRIRSTDNQMSRSSSRPGNAQGPQQGNASASRSRDATDRSHTHIHLGGEKHFITAPLMHLCPPSPALSISNLSDDNIPTRQDNIHGPMSSASQSTNTRKRLRSEDHDQPDPKRARNSASAMPSESDLDREFTAGASDHVLYDDWFQRNSLDTGDAGEQVDIEVFNYKSPGTGFSSAHISEGLSSPDTSMTGSSSLVSGDTSLIYGNFAVTSQVSDFGQLFSDFGEALSKPSESIVDVIGLPAPAWDGRAVTSNSQAQEPSCTSMQAWTQFALTDNSGTCLGYAPTDFSRWLIAPHDPTVSVDSDDIGLSLFGPSGPSEALLNFSELQTPFAGFTRPLSTPHSSREAKRRRLEEIRVEALRIEQELAVSSYH